MKTNCFNRIASLATAVVFMITSTAYGVPRNLQDQQKEFPPLEKGGEGGFFIDPAKLVVPENFGSITERFKSAGTANSRKLIINIQDSHCNYEAQTNISKIIEAMSADKETAQALKLIATEGAQGVVDPTFPRSFPDPKIRQEATDYFVKIGWLTGAESYAINFKEEPLPLWGIEEKALYDENLEYFKKAKAGMEQEKAFMEKLSALIEVLKLKVFSGGLAELVKMHDDWDNNAVIFTDYCTYIEKLAVENGIGGEAVPAPLPLPRGERAGERVKIFKDPVEYPNFTMVIESMALEKKIDPKKIDPERASLIDELQKKMVKEEISELVRQSLYLRTGKITSEMFYSYLNDMISAKKIDIAQYPNLAVYMDIVFLSDKVKAAELFDEIDRLEKEIKGKMYANGPQKELDETIDQVKILRNLLDLKMTRRDLSYYRERRRFLTPDELVRKVARVAADSGMRDALAGSIAWLESNKEINLAACEKFYDAALRRDKVMVEKTVEEMEKRKATAVAVVTGGFHTQGMKELFKAKGYSYVIVTPRMTQQYDDKVYLARMLNEQSEFDKLFANTGNRLTAWTMLGTPKFNEACTVEMLAKDNTMKQAWVEELMKNNPELARYVIDIDIAGPVEGKYTMKLILDKAGNYTTRQFTLTSDGGVQFVEGSMVVGKAFPETQTIIALKRLSALKRVDVDFNRLGKIIDSIDAKWNDSVLISKVSDEDREFIETISKEIKDTEHDTWLKLLGHLIINCRGGPALGFGALKREEAQWAAGEGEGKTEEEEIRDLENIAKSKDLSVLLEQMEFAGLHDGKPYFRPVERNKKGQQSLLWKKNRFMSKSHPLYGRLLEAYKKIEEALLGKVSDKTLKIPGVTWPAQVGQTGKSSAPSGIVDWLLGFVGDKGPGREDLDDAARAQFMKNIEKARATKSVSDVTETPEVQKIMEQMKKSIRTDANGDTLVGEAWNKIKVEALPRSNFIKEASAHVERLEDGTVRVYIADDLLNKGNEVYLAAVLRFEIMKKFLGYTHIEALSWMVNEDAIKRYERDLSNPDREKEALDMLMGLAMPLDDKGIDKRIDKYRRQIIDGLRAKNPGLTEEDLSKMAKERFERNRVREKVGDIAQRTAKLSGEILLKKAKSLMQEAKKAGLGTKKYKDALTKFIGIVKTVPGLMQSDDVKFLIGAMDKAKYAEEEARKALALVYSKNESMRNDADLNPVLLAAARDAANEKISGNMPLTLDDARALSDAAAQGAKAGTITSVMIDKWSKKIKEAVELLPEDKRAVDILPSFQKKIDEALKMAKRREIAAAARREAVEVPTWGEWLQSQFAVGLGTAVAIITFGYFRMNAPPGEYDENQMIENLKKFRDAVQTDLTSELPADLAATGWEMKSVDGKVTGSDTSDKFDQGKHGLSDYQMDTVNKVIWVAGPMTPAKRDALIHEVAEIRKDEGIERELEKELGKPYIDAMKSFSELKKQLLDHELNGVKRDDPRYANALKEAIKQLAQPFAVRGKEMSLFDIMENKRKASHFAGLKAEKWANGMPVRVFDALIQSKDTDTEYLQKLVQNTDAEITRIKENPFHPDREAAIAMALRTEQTARAALLKLALQKEDYSAISTADIVKKAILNVIESGNMDLVYDFLVTGVGKNIPLDNRKTAQGIIDYLLTNPEAMLNYMSPALLSMTKEDLEKLPLDEGARAGLNAKLKEKKTEGELIEKGKEILFGAASKNARIMENADKMNCNLADAKNQGAANYVEVAFLLGLSPEERAVRLASVKHAQGIGVEQLLGLTDEQSKDVEAMKIVDELKAAGVRVLQGADSKALAEKLRSDPVVIKGKRLSLMVYEDNRAAYADIIEMGQIVALLVSGKGGELKRYDFELIEKIGLKNIAAQIRSGDMKLLELLEIKSTSIDEKQAAYSTLGFQA